MVLILDIGNTRIKAAVYQNDRQVHFLQLPKSEYLNNLQKLLTLFDISHSMISCVGQLDNQLLTFLENNTTCTVLTHKLKLPFKNLYTTPKSLGVDRIALVAAACSKFPSSHVLVLDAGTCLTYDFVDNQSQYLGGAISPGLHMRYKSLDHYTAALPLLSPTIPNDFIGKSSSESIHSGIVNSIIYEIDGVIDQYQKRFQKLTTVLTGGDSNFLAKQLKSSIFVRQFFLIEGIYKIFKLNR